MVAARAGCKAVMGCQDSPYPFLLLDSVKQGLVLGAGGLRRCVVCGAFLMSFLFRFLPQIPIRASEWSHQLRRVKHIPVNAILSKSPVYVVSVLPYPHY